MHIRAASAMILSLLRRTVTSVSVKIVLAAVFFLLALAATLTGGIFQGWYIFEPFFLTPHATLFVLSSVAFLIAAARQILRVLLREKPIEFDGDPAIPSNFDNTDAHVIYYLLPRSLTDPPAPYLPVQPTEIDLA